MLLRESGAMRHMTADSSRGQERWVELLIQKVFDELPTDLRLCVRPVTTATSGCLLQNAATECINSIPVHIARSLLPQRLCVATQPLPKNASLGVFSYQSETVSLISREVTRGISVSQNATRRSVECPCGELHVEFFTTCQVQQGEATLLVKSEGSSSNLMGLVTPQAEQEGRVLHFLNCKLMGLPFSIGKQEQQEHVMIALKMS